MTRTRDRDASADEQFMPENSRRRYYFDSAQNSLVVVVTEGDFYVSTSPYEMLSAVLGSCIAVCIWDPEARCGGMNHFLLPTEAGSDDRLPSAQLRYGSYSIERLVNALIGRGAIRDRMEVKVFGGANILMHLGNFGHANADFVEEYLRREKLKVVASSLRGTEPRRVRFHASTGRATANVTNRVKRETLAKHETQLSTRLRPKQTGSRFELFE